MSGSGRSRPPAPAPSSRSTPPAGLQEPGFAELRAGATRVTIVPALGGQITALELAGHQWLGAAGYVDAFPSVEAHELPAWVTGRAGVVLPAGGELRTRPADFEVRTLDGGMSAICRWQGERLPYRFERVVQVDRSGEVTMRYAVTNEGAERLPIVWAGETALPLTARTRVVLPDGTPLRVAAQQGIDLLGVGAEHRWPKLRAAKRIVDFGTPAAVGRRFFCRLIAHPGAGAVAIDEGETRLELRYAAAEVPSLSLSFDRPGGIVRQREARLLVAPSIGIAAPGAPDASAWLEPAETRRWTLAWRGVATRR